MRSFKFQTNFIIVILLLSTLGCLNQIQPSPFRNYYEMQTIFINTWNTYHKAYQALPSTDVRKQDWLKTYHPIFLRTSQALISYDPSTGNLGALDQIISECENILIQISIDKGVSK